MGGCRYLIGSIKSLQNLGALEKLNIRECSNLTGDINVLKAMTAMTHLDLHGCRKLEGNLFHACQNMHKLAELDITSTMLKGEIEFQQNHPNRTKLLVLGVDGTIVGQSTW